MLWNYELLVRQRQQELRQEAERNRLVAEARRARSGWPLRKRLRTAASQVWAAARLRSRVA